MGVQQTDTIDFVSKDKATGQVVLTLVDALPWQDDEVSFDDHVLLLQKKLQAYISCIESDEISEHAADHRERGVRIDIRFQFRCPEFIEEGIRSASEQSGIPILMLQPE